MYQAFALDRATVGYFLVNEITKFSPRKMHTPEVNLLVAKQVTQSTSAKPLMASEIMA